MKVYVTKYALTQGIIEHEAKVCDSKGEMILVEAEKFAYLNQYFHKGEWFTDLDAAKKRANEMVNAKVKSLTKALLKYSKMHF